MNNYDELVAIRQRIDDQARDTGGQAKMNVSVRDYFAAQSIHLAGERCGPPNEIAQWAYRVADAMLEARKK